MANILSTDDSQFIGGVGNWIVNPTFALSTAISTSATPTPPGGGNDLVLTEIQGTVGGIGRAVGVRIFRPHYPTLNGTVYSFSVEAYLDPTNAADPAGVTLNASVVGYSSVGAGIVEGSVFIPSMSPGWTTVTIPSTTMTRPEDPLYVGIGVTFGQAEGAPTTGLLLDDKAYIANVNLSTPPAALGGWGVGMVRMNSGS